MNVSGEPLLFLAIPTYNRAAVLDRLLASIEPQLALHPEVSVFISDNASTDKTPEVIASYRGRGMRFEEYRQEANLGPDANFLTCFRAARGKYFWLLGDDEVLMPNGFDLVLPHLSIEDPQQELDLLHLSSYSYRENFMAEYQSDRFGRRYHTFTKVEPFTSLVNINFTFISANIIHRERLMMLSREDPARYLGTNLIQLSWTLPLLQAHRRSRLVFEKAYASRMDASGGYSVGRVFGENLSRLTARLLPKRPDLAARIMNIAMRRWFPGTIYDLRAMNSKELIWQEMDEVLRPLFGKNPRYWLFIYPAIHFSLPVANVFVKVGRMVNRVLDRSRDPLYWRKVT